MPSFSCIVDVSLPPGVRLDRYAAENLKILSRSQIKARGLEARINGKPVKLSRVLRGGESLELSWAEAVSPFLVPQDIPLDIIYEDERVIVVNKAQGMVVHPGAGNTDGTLANALFRIQLEKEKLRRAEGGLHGTVPSPAGLRPGIVHRLDKDTSGVIIAARDDEALVFLADQFKARTVRKTYAAIVRGCPGEHSGIIEKRIVRSRKDRKIFTVSDSEGRASLTFFRVVRTWGNYSLLLLRPKTGRTHQIRVHLKHYGIPILGDPLYGREDPYFKKASLMLHAKTLSLILPGGERRIYRTRFPDRFREIISALNKAGRNRR